MQQHPFDSDRDKCSGSLRETTSIACRPYESLCKRQRKVYHVRLNAKLANNYLPYQYFETRQLLHDLLEKPAEYRHSIERFTISIGSTIAYGRRMPQLMFRR
ncbi:hypothetical protein BDW69DRAFT_176902 [Aspergillus filifer]